MIYVTRHGQTEWNILKKVMGKADKPLNETGIQQAKKAREDLKEKHIDLIICSPLLRAKQTAEIINENRNIEIIYDERLSERDFGEFEGFHISQFDFSKYWDYHKNVKYKCAENIQDFFSRVYEFLDEILIKYADKHILLVTHSGVSVSVSCYFNDNIPKNSLIDSGLDLSSCEIRTFEPV